MRLSLNVWIPLVLASQPFIQPTRLRPDAEPLPRPKRRKFKPSWPCNQRGRGRR